MVLLARVPLRPPSRDWWQARLRRDAIDLLKSGRPRRSADPCRKYSLGIGAWEMANAHAAHNPGDRPFPWRCPRCLAVDVHPVVIRYTARVKHDGTEYTIEIPALEVPKCQSCG